MPGDHYYDLDPEGGGEWASVGSGLLGRARDAVLEARARLQELEAGSGPVAPHTPKALELLAAALAEIDAAVEESARG
jgi:hypothetical protein